MINKQHDQISLRKQCVLLGLTRSSVYHVPAIAADESAIANKIHELWLKKPMYGYRKITKQLQRYSYNINHKRVLRIMREMRIQAIYQRPKTSTGNPEHQKYPYLLNGLAITRPNQVWATDITYIKLSSGFVYLIALIDVYSRYCVGWILANTMDGAHCRAMLEKVLKKGIAPEIINTDQGTQFTGIEWIELVEKRGIKVSMDGKGRWADNIYIERFWRTIKYEHIFLHACETLTETRASIGRFIHEYNYERLHQSLGYATPAEVYGGYVTTDMVMVSRKAGNDRLGATPSVHLGLQAYPLANTTALPA